MSMSVMTAVFYAKGMTATEKVVSLAYADHAHDDGTEARAGIDRIALKSALSRRTVQKTISSLVEKGILAVQRSATNKLPTCYRFLLTDDERSLRFGQANSAPQNDVGGADGTAGGADDDSLGCPTFTQIINEPSVETLSSTLTPPGSEKWTDEVKALTSLLCDWNVDNGYKAFTLGPKQWANMDKLLRIDQRGEQEVRAVIEWCQRDAFWNQNIRSTYKLREKYDSLLGRMRHEGVSVGGSASEAVLSPDQKNIALIYDCYDQGLEWYNDTTGEMTLDNPAFFGYNRARDAQGNIIDAEGRPYKLTAQGQRQRVE